MQHDALLPRPPGGLAPGAVLALLVHAGLLAGLTLAVDWRMKAPDTVSAELWAALPQIAARSEEAAAPVPSPAPPPPVVAAPTPVPVPAPPDPTPRPPEPAPPPPKIAIEREKPKEPEPKKPPPAKDKPETPAQKKKREADARKAEQAALLAQQAEEAATAAANTKAREEQLRRMMGALPGASTGTAAADAGPSKAYAGKLVKAILDNVFFADSVNGNPAAEVEISAGASGSIISRRLLKSSGNKAWDEAVLRAIDRISTLPRDENGRVPPLITVTFRPKDLTSAGASASTATGTAGAR